MDNKDKAKSIFGTLWSFFTTFVISVIAICAVGLVVLHFTGVEFFTVESASMTPKYPKDALVFVKDVPPESIKVGDVVTYVLNKNGVLVTHRVVSVDNNEETFTTKGDANDSEDPKPVLWGNVVGKVVFGVPKIGAVFRLFSGKDAKIYLVAVIVVLGIISVAGDIAEKRRKKKEGDSEKSEDLSSNE